MLVVTIDAYSGRANPSYILDGADATQVVRELTRNLGAFGTCDPAFSRLGFRGVTVGFLGDGIARSHNLPQTIHLATGHSQQEGKAQEIAEKLIRRMVNQKGQRRYRNDPINITDALAAHLIQEMDQLNMGAPDLTAVDIDWGPAVRVSGIESIWGHLTPVPPGGGPGGHKPGHQRGICPIEVREYDPDHWNDPTHVFQNNCYNYAANQRTGTLAQPGWYSGVELQTFACTEVSEAAAKDGAKRRGDCLTDDQKPRWLVALAYDPVRDDYHWYRLHAEGFWGHKPGRSPATNSDNSKRIVYNPEHCVRGGYTEFCGYFYFPHGMRIE
jgi:hypothetical protein